MVGQFSRRLLLFDDDALIRKLIARHMVAAGYVARTAEDGLDAIAKLHARLPDLIITDFYMPRMSGMELLGVVASASRKSRPSLLTPQPRMKSWKRSPPTLTGTRVARNFSSSLKPSQT
jgi:CheY-like chemotaxis protein